MKRLVATMLAALALGGASACIAGDEVQPAVKPFVAGSMEQIRQRYQDKPFILALWSMTCTHCPAELKTLGQLKQRYPQLNIVLVAADTPEEGGEVARLAKAYGLGKVEQWVFADPMPERIRAEIDRRWYGELPKTYWYVGGKLVESVAGVVPQAQLEHWAKTSRR